MVTYLLIGWRHYDVIGWRHKTTSGPVPPQRLYCTGISFGRHGENPQLVLCFTYLAKWQVPVSKDFNVDSVHHNLLILDQLWKCNRSTVFLRHTVLGLLLLHCVPKTRDYVFGVKLSCPFTNIFGTLITETVTIGHRQMLLFFHLTYI